MGVVVGVGVKVGLGVEVRFGAGLGVRVGAACRGAWAPAEMRVRLSARVRVHGLGC